MTEPACGLRPLPLRAGGREQWREVLGGFWGPFRDNLAQVAGVSVTDIIDVLNDQLGAHFFPQQARYCTITTTTATVFPSRWLLVRSRPCMSIMHWLKESCHIVAFSHTVLAGDASSRCLLFGKCHQSAHPTFVQRCHSKH